MKPKFHVGERVVVSDIDAIKHYGGALPLVGWVDRCEEILDGKRHRGWFVYIRPDRLEEPIVRYMQHQLSRVTLKQYGKKYPIEQF